jgi:photosystem II stability/assembly factor-like uncharacterized protein
VRAQTQSPARRDGDGQPSLRDLIALRWLAAGVACVVACFVVAAWQDGYPRPFRPTAERSLIDWLRYPIERNAWKRLPGVRAGLNCAFFTADGQRGWAVGDDGTIVTTRDAGATWTAQSSGTDARLRSVVFTTEGQRGWAVGVRGTILTTRDAGATWTAQSSGTNAANLYSVVFAADGQRGWAVGDDGGILATRDAGTTWTDQFKVRGTYPGLWSAAFTVDGQRGWAVGDHGKILATRDAGATWTAQSSGTDADLRSVVFTADGQRGWVVGADGTIVATRDAGGTWTAQSSGTHARLYSVVFSADGRRGWAVGEDGTILATRDAGATWVAQSSGCRFRLSSVVFTADGELGWAVAENGSIVATRDAGTTWTVRTIGSSMGLSSVVFDADGQRGWAVGDDGTIVTTRDAGTTWAAETSGTSAALSSVFFLADGERGWAVGRDPGTIIATRDAGASWTVRPIDADVKPLSSIFFTADGKRGWAVGWYSTIIASRDAGATWAAQAAHFSVALSSVVFTPDGERGWAVGNLGTIVGTRDGGASWTEERSGTAAHLSSVASAPDGRRGWAVGEDGTIVVTRDAGTTWTAQPSGTAAYLSSVVFTPDGERGWAVGKRGTIIATRDAGATWMAQAGGTSADLSSVAVAADGQRGWAVGDGGTIITTRDTGTTWTPILYHRYPAPWFWLALPITLVFVRRAFVAGTLPIADAITAIGASDGAVTAFADDRLQFAPLARGISRFLRNDGTEPPLTLAITGDWGSGKSSLMQLVSADLRTHGYKPVFFNAWHHQKEEQLLAALLAEVRRQGLPSLLGPSGWAFRLRLLWVRSKKHFAITFGVLAGLSALVAYRGFHSAADWDALWAWLKGQTDLWDVVQSLATKLTDVPFLAKAVPILAAIVTTVRGATAFVPEPAAFLRSVAERVRLRDPGTRTSYRARFAEQFREVTEALPYRTVIAIDDLDRCKPDTVLDVMEAVNLLTSSGTCIVIFGMATERVQAALGLAFEAIAKELVDLDKPTDADDNAAQRYKRRAYARDYLEKLINIEVTVPRREDIPPHVLLLQRRSMSEQLLTRTTRRLVAAWPMYVVAAAIAAGLGIGRWFQPPALPAPPAVATATNPAPTAPPSPSATPTPSAALTSRGQESPSAARVAADIVVPGDDPTLSPVYLVAGIGVLVAALVLFGWPHLRAAWRTVTDSEEFETALRIWSPVIAARRNTPRAIKRFGNRIRYLAMLQQGETLDRPAWVDALEQLRAQFRRTSGRSRVLGTAPRTLSSTGLPEDRLIALGALFDALGRRWRDAFDAGFPGYADVGDALRRAVAQALDAHMNEFGQTWPPTTEEVETFERLLAGVRMPGDVEIIRPSAAEASATAAGDASLAADRDTVEDEPEPDLEPERTGLTSDGAPVSSIRPTQRGGTAKKKTVHPK